MSLALQQAQTVLHRHRWQTLNFKTSMKKLKSTWSQD